MATHKQEIEKLKEQIEELQDELDKCKEEEEGNSYYYLSTSEELEKALNNFFSQENQSEIDKFMADYPDFDSSPFEE